jgi:hypothetical protein
MVMMQFPCSVLKLMHCWLHRHLFRCAELTVTKLNLITKEQALLRHYSGEAASQLFLLHGVYVLWCFRN